MNAYCIHFGYNACMTTLSVRDVPEETLALLRARAAANRQSLQAYIREMLDREAYALSIEQAAREADRLAGSVDITTDDVLTAIEEMRQARQ
jgi:plasmid stability protein